MKAIGLGHSFESAVADLVDNSIDAGASDVLIRFILHSGLVDRMLVVDNGVGMDEGTIDQAMQLGHAKADSARTLGHYGMGLKSASFSQASVLTVLSRRKHSPAVGRRMFRETQDAGFEYEVLAADQVSDALDSYWPSLDTTTGTVVRWDSIRTFPASTDASVTDDFIETKQNALRHHLGLMFHRLIASRRVSIGIDVHDAELEESGFLFRVEPIDPFAYVRSGQAGYPRILLAHCNGTSIPLHCHVWPGRSDSQFFRLAGGSPEQYQGFYLYRNDRLLSAGRWGGVVQETKRRTLARVSIDIEDHLSAFTMSMEKTGVRMVPDLVRAIEVAESADGVSFGEYIQDAETVFRASNTRVRKRQPILPPGKGLSPRVKKTLARELNFMEGERPLSIKWKRFSSSDFLQVDRTTRTLWLNSAYREAVLHGTRGGANDAPLLKSLLFLLYEDIFRGVAFGPKDKDNVSMWLGILTTAAETEAEDFYE